MTRRNNPGLQPKAQGRPSWLWLICCLLGLAFLAGPAPQQAFAQDSCVPVQTAAVETRDLKETVRGIGTLEAIQEVMIRPEINGLLEAVHVEEGSRVKKGERLFSIDDNKIREQLRAKKAALEEARANLKNARLVYNRRERLYKQDLGTEAARDEAEARFKALSAQVERLKAEIAGTRESLADTRIKAPFDGLIGERHVDAGEWVKAGAALAPLVQVERLKIAFTVPEKYAGRVAPGQTVEVQAAAASKKMVTGSVYFASPIIRQDTRTLLVKAYINNPEAVFLPGGFASVDLVLEVMKDRPVIPEEALIPTRTGYMVFVVDQSRRARGQSVEVGLRHPGIVEITQGVKPGDTVIQAGHISVKEGDRVCERDKNQG